MKLCFATHNSHKLSEVQEILGDSFDIIGLEQLECDESPLEDKDTIEENSCHKANFIHKLYSIDCFADDSGLEVNKLDGFPGVDSAHYAGYHRSDNDNMNLLLSNLEWESDRTAQFKTVITLILGKKIKQFEGIVKGNITKVKKGVNGFGYDPIFIPEGYNKTFGEMTDQEKNAISHRGIAIKKLADFLINKKH